jgi:hypothetical protein
MTIDRSSARFQRSVFFLALFLLVALVIPGCVSVQKTGEGKPLPPPATTNVAFSSEPGNCEVYVNGQFRGTTPVTLYLAAGAHALEFRLAGYQTWSRELVVVAGDDTRVAATMVPE